MKNRNERREHVPTAVGTDYSSGIIVKLKILIPK